MMETGSMSFNLAGALGAQAFAFFMAVFVLAAPQPGQLSAQNWTTASLPAANQVLPDNLGNLPHTGCLGVPLSYQPEPERAACIALLTAAVAEIDGTDPSPLDSPALDMLTEKVRVAAMERCRDMWRVLGPTDAMHQSASCVLVAPDIALPAAMQ